MKRIRACKTGNTILKIFLLSTLAFACYYLKDLFQSPFGFSGFREDPSMFIVKVLLIVIVESILFWVGIITVYLNCKQLGIKWRALGIIFGMVPILNLIMLGKIIKTADDEVKFETKKIKLNLERKDDKICKTKYPILMVHGVFFRDFEHLNYWGRVPQELIDNGATIFYGEHNSASTVEKSGEELAKRIKEIKAQTGCEKVNVIAHSKGGLDMRYAITKCGAYEDVASLTTINTPHRGCEFADCLLEKIPEAQKLTVARAYNAGAATFGDVNPDFIGAVTDLTHKACEKRNEELPDREEVYYQSVGSIQTRPTAGRFPLNMSYLLVKFFDGKNDGLVGESSFPWGSDFKMLEPKGKRGISHGDMIDLNRENIKDFDVREFYVNLVEDLRLKGF
ncbi:esterase/lipase family protein [Butyrivibrio sp. M55]|uniref:esterase/lipase family protein n=1 Tax=Butyrivibrio sp. M55 TaxID=1855323 RepID=UPI0008EE94E1|nr:triacylglycerol lipase [Butyrivibrio sp. M55]SFU90161.1 triacylglycerol lipase [Butyrivibrio sp. M55]